MTRNINPDDCNCPMDCNSMIFTPEISTEQLYPLYSQSFNLLSNINNALWNLEKQMNNVTDLYQRKILKDKYDDIIASSSVAHFYFKENGIIKYSQEEVFGTMDLIGNT